MEALQFNPTEEMLLMVAAALFVVQLIYYVTLYGRIYRRQRAVDGNEHHFTQDFPPISVIICAREECENLRRNLTSILEQDYPCFEVIVINDGHTDESEDYLTLLEERYPHLYHSFVPDSSRYISRKKLALTLGIKASKYDWLVLTEAKAAPASNQWLRLLARNFTSHTSVVLGYSGYERGHGWLHKRVSFDNLFTGMRYLGFALAGHPYMAIGRNLAYRKSLFYSAKGFTAHLTLQRGDDDLFINQVARGENTRVETDAAAVMRIPPVSRAKDWREEKIGYASTARLYRGVQRWLLGAETLTRLAFYVSWVWLLVLSLLEAHWLGAGLALLLFLLRWVLQLYVINRTAAALEEKRRYYLSLPLFDLLQPCQSLRWKLYCLFRKKSDFLRK